MRFSVIIPLYNKAPYIKKSLESVISQSFRDFEIIVIDDGSSDNSFLIAEDALAKSMVSYKLLKQENSGVSAARNNGVSASCGDFICFLDADDWWAPTFLEKMDKFILEYPDAGIYATNYFYVKNGRPQVSVTNAETGHINYFKVYAERLQNPIWTGAVCVPRPIFTETGGFRHHLRLGEDFDLWIRITLKYKVAFLREPLSYYYQDSDASWRLVGKLHNPSVHILWNLQYMEDEENINPDYKALIDNLRTYSLLPYYLSNRYRSDARNELSKVDWDKQPKKTQRLYKMPIPLLKCRQTIRRFGSAIKQSILKHI